MIDKEVSARAGEAFKAVYEAFTARVLPCVLRDKSASDHLPRSLEQKVFGTDQKPGNANYDIRAPRWVSSSGKGSSKYPGLMAVSLVDHSLSVARGGAIFCGLHLAGEGEDDGVVLAGIAYAFLIGFFHDIDKLEGASGDSAGTMAELYENYAVGAFLADLGLPLSVEELVFGIGAAEQRTLFSGKEPDFADSRKKRLVLVAGSFVKDADQLDAAFLDTSRTKDGRPLDMAERVQEVLGRKSLAANARGIFEGWRFLVIYDGHHSFVMDTLLTSLALGCDEVAGIYPLISFYHDGILLTALPEAHFDEIVSTAIDDTVDSLPSESTLVMTSRGGAKISGDVPSGWSDVRKMFSPERIVANWNDNSKLLAIHDLLMVPLRTEIVALFAAAGLPFRTPAKKEAGLIPCISTIDEASVDYRVLHKALTAGLALSYESPVKIKNAPTPVERVEQLFSLIGPRLEQFEWLGKAVAEADLSSRRTLATVGMLVAMAGDPELERTLFGAGGLFERFCNGTEDSPSIFTAQAGRIGAIRAGMREYLRDLCRGELIARDAVGDGACFITGIPASLDSHVKQDSGIYGVKSSAFSYRDGRPEDRYGAKVATLFSPISEAEYRIRQSEFSRAKIGASDGIPVRLYSPVAFGLFGGVVFDVADEDLRDSQVRFLSIYRLARHAKSDDEAKDLNGDIFTVPTRLARFDAMPSSLKNRLPFIRLILGAIRRTGRPVHVFRGLPVFHPAAFYMDCLDSEVRDLIGGDSLRLDEIPMAIRKLQLAEKLAATNLLSLMKRMARKEDRLGGLCLAFKLLEERGELDDEIKMTLELLLRQEEETHMSEATNPAVELGRLAPSIQRRPSFQASNTEKEKLIRLAFEASDAARRLRVGNDRAALVAAVGGHITREVSRSGTFFSAAHARKDGQTIDDAIAEFSEVFVDGFVLGDDKPKVLSSEKRRLVIAMYLWAAKETWERISKERKDQESETADAA